MPILYLLYTIRFNVTLHQNIFQDSKYISNTKQLWNLICYKHFSKLKLQLFISRGYILRCTYLHFSISNIVVQFKETIYNAVNHKSSLFLLKKNYLSSLTVFVIYTVHHVRSHIIEPKMIKQLLLIFTKLCKLQQETI